MNLRSIFLAAVLSVAAFTTLTAAGDVPPVAVVPKPLEVNVKDGVCRLALPLTVNAHGEEELEQIGSLANGYLQRDGIAELCCDRDGTRLDLMIDDRLGTEEYVLTIEGGSVAIRGGAANGVFYGVQTLRQLAFQYNGGDGCVLPQIEIKDRPEFAYRSGMLDVCRHFFTVEEVKKYIDILALHKMNTFHWHLTDDQGWRIEIDRYPELTSVSAWRDGTLLGHAMSHHKVFANIRYGGYYTKEDIGEVVQYASERYINIIPEVEMPGHASAVLAAYPHLGCRGEGYEVEGRWGIFDDAFCAGREATFEFLENVLEEVIDMFPSRVIHIGGDECRKGRWKECPDCQRRIADEDLADEYELQAYFMKRMERWLNEHGRSIIGWDEILEGGVSESATVMSWRGAKGGIEAAKMGNYVVMVPNTHCYLDYYQSERKETEPMAIGNYIPIEKTYTLDPYEGLDEHERQYILGVQGNLWTEYVPNFGHAQYMLLPRLAAIAETGWSYGNKDYEDFRARMRNVAAIYDVERYPYARYIFD